MNKVSVNLLLMGSIITAVGGIVGFLILFIPDFNIYWLILSPIIIAFYEAPAVFLYWLYKKNKKKNQ
jgi:Ca2+/Na+ antiporter